MARRSPSVILAALAVLVALLPLTPAAAEVRVRRDAAGDAPAGIDVRKVAYTHRNAKVKVRAVVPRLGRAGEAALSISRFDVFEAGYVARVIKRPGRAPRVRLGYFDHFDLLPRRCARMAGSWRDGVIRIAVPTDCLAGHARRRVFVQFGIARGDHVDMTPAVRRLARD